MHRTRIMVFTIIFALHACINNDDEKTIHPNDLGVPVDLKPTLDSYAQILCGKNTLFRGECGTRCPSPCICVTFFDPDVAGFQPYKLCATPCTIPGSCPNEERCAILYGLNTSKTPVCLPENLQTVPEKPQVFLDCFPSKYLTTPRCESNYLVQQQPFFIKGNLTGSYCAHVLQKTCSSGCKTTDAGIPICESNNDGGVNFTDSGSPLCCPKIYFGSCRVVGNAKLPPYGCEMTCCQSCQWKDIIKNGCPTWVPIKMDAGSDSNKD